MDRQLKFVPSSYPVHVKILVRVVEDAVEAVKVVVVVVDAVEALVMIVMIQVDKSLNCQPKKPLRKL